jgi:hypothetical protein
MILSMNTIPLILLLGLVGIYIDEIAKVSPAPLLSVHG